MASSSPEHIIIIGAGFGGLLLAHGLKKHGISFSVYERDTSAQARGQGYRIKIFPGKPVTDMQSLLPAESWRLFEQTCGETVMGETTLNALDARPLASRRLNGPVPYTVDRAVLRTVLLRGLEDKVHWGKSFERYELQDDGVTVHFTGGSTTTGSLVVGADGGRSAMRNQYIGKEYKLLDPEGICLYGKVPITRELLARMNPRFQKWMTLCRDVAPLIQQVIWSSELPITMFVEKMHFEHRAQARADAPDLPPLPEDYVYWPHGIGFGCSNAAISTGYWAHEWDPSIRCLVEPQDPAQGSMLRVMITSPELPRWTPNARITLLGDSIHVMSPAGGVGAATALKDAAELTRILASKGRSAESNGEYEEGMRSYAAVSLLRSFRGGELIFGQPDYEDCKELVIE
ncbi:Protein phosphatase 2c [Penicillium tannophilum]|nr:Protein phosphatase 2c [Penicillium tannophilum]